MTPFRLACLDLARRPVTSAIAIVSVALAVATSGVLLRLTRVSQDRYTGLAHASEALIGAKQGGIEMLLGALGGEGDLPDYVPLRLFETLRGEVETHATTPIRKITPFLYFARVGRTRVVGTDSGLVEGVGALALDEALAGADVDLNGSVQADLWLKQPSQSRVTLNLRGRLPRTGTAFDRMVFTTVATAHQALGQVPEPSIWGKDVLHYFLVDLKPGGFPSLKALINGRTVAEANLVGEQTARLRTLSGTGENLGVFVTTLVLVLGGLSVAAMLITRFEAMSLQLAVLRAIGFDLSFVARWLLWEGFLLGVFATLIGLALDAATFPALRHMLGAALPAPEVAPSALWQSAPVWITAILATSASVLIPLARAYRQDPHFSLRS